MANPILGALLGAAPLGPIEDPFQQALELERKRKEIAEAIGGVPGNAPFEAASVEAAPAVIPPNLEQAPASDEFDLVKMLTGDTGAGLRTKGMEEYPQENAPLNHPAHRLGAKRLTERFGVLPAQAMGLLNEAWEGYNTGEGDERDLIGVGENAKMDISDIMANVRGSADARYPGWEENPLIKALAGALRR